MVGPKVSFPALERYERELATLNEEEGSIVNRADAEARDLSDAEAARLDAIEARRVKMTDDLDRHSRVLKARADLVESKARETIRSHQARITGGTLAIARDPMAGYQHGGQFLADLRAVHETGVYTERLRAYAAATTSANEKTGPGGGWAVPSGPAGPIAQAIAGAGSLLDAMRPVFVDRTTPIPVDPSGSWSTSGVQAAPTAEGDATTATIPALSQATPTLYKATVLVHAGEEFMSDTPAAFDALAKMIGRALRGVVERWILRGSGVGEPLGILNSPALIAVPGTGAGTLTAAHVAADAGRIVPGDPGAFIVASPSATGALAAIELAGGRLPAPVVTSMEAPALGTAGDCTFVAPSGFAVHVKAGSFTPQATIYFQFDQGLHSLRAWVRLGMVPLLAAPVTPAVDTSTTVSHCVTTATRT
jgi:HK97 family phage major capsid protein